MNIKGINPIKFAKEVNESFLNYQLTAFPFTDDDLNNQARVLLKGNIGNSPMIKGPFISLSKSFLEGKTIDTLIKDGIAHPALKGIAPFPTLFKHQEKAYEAINNDYNCLISTGTGSGKTEAFMLPIVNYCLKLRDENIPDGIAAILVYPMNALANDQLDRLREMLAGSGISFGMYVGSTPKDNGESGNITRLTKEQGKEEYLKQKRKSSDGELISPYEERLTEKDIINNPPRILLTNINQLELLLTRNRDIGMFIDAPLKYIVFDEVHTYNGVKGAEVSCLIRRLKAFCGKTADEVVCIGTSATITDEENIDVASKFASRFFGINQLKVKLVEEEYKNEIITNSIKVNSIPTGIDVLILDKLLSAIEANDTNEIGNIYSIITNANYTFTDEVRKELYNLLSNNSYIYYLTQVLENSCHVEEVVSRINKRLGRKNVDLVVAQVELFCYLALGAYAESEGKILLKPKIHYFIKGLDGVVATFDDTNNGIKPILSMNKEAAINKFGINAEACFPTLVCNSCGQHYFEGYYQGLVIKDGKISGGQIEGVNSIYLPSENCSEGRAIFTNKFFSLEDDEFEEIVEKKLSKKINEMYLCRFCGTLHALYTEQCGNPKCKRVNGIVKVSIVKKMEENKLLTCPSCGRKGTKRDGIIKYEAVRPLRATAVSDNHILAQNIINEIDGDNKKLIMFADNRQDAAFQAGWMKDRTRRYRFRHLVYEYLKEKNEIVSIDEIVKYLLELCIKDEELALALAPEVFATEKRESYSKRWINVLEKYWRFTVIRELASTFKVRDSLENWGVIKAVYYGINENNTWIQLWANKFSIEADDLKEGIYSLLDKIRRDLLLYDESTEIFSKQWSYGDTEVQNGFIPYMEFPPKGLVEFEEANDKKVYQKPFRSNKNNTAIEEFVKKWNINKNLFDSFLNELWVYLTEDTKILKKVQLKGRKAIIASNVYQIDSYKIGIIIENKRYKCNVCQRVHTRLSPNGACTGWQCKGKLQLDIPKEEDYNINMLKYPFSMVIAKEHSAQVPAKEREEIEASFKSKEGKVNCLVATPTLEMGVDIGDLDVVLMRNVPPKSSNYWQRAGRAGRKHRMAVIYTYCRQSEHDRYFFKDPEQMLKGNIEPPRFNLRNEIMLRKHIHASVISYLIKLERSNNIGVEEQEKIKEIMSATFPTYITDYLFYNKEIPREEVYNVAKFREVIYIYKDELSKSTRESFEAFWPKEDSIIITKEAIEKYIDEMVDDLQNVIIRMHKRMRWAVNKMRSIDSPSATAEEKKILNRCDSFLGKLKKNSISNYTLTVLATEGFLPGYGVYETSINGYAKNDYSSLKLTKDFELNRPSSMAVREFVPGNMIYANGGKYKCAYYHLAANKEELNLENYFVDTNTNIIKKTINNKITGYNEVGQSVQALPINDLTLTFTSRIVDEELNRFQMPVNIMGELEKHHSGIRVYGITDKQISHHFGQEIRLINIGSAERVKEGKLGYPICSVCGGLRSPYSSEKEINEFKEKHKKSCGKEVEYLLLYSDSKVDGLKFTGFENQQEAVNFGESIKIGASLLVDMDIEDLQYIVCHLNDNEFMTFVYDPMPGGSGILQQIIESWDELIVKTIKQLNSCEGKCESSCYSCMRTYRNVFVHTMLDRYLAIDMLQSWRGDLEFSHEIEANIELTQTNESEGTNRGEKALFEILNKEGFPTFIEQKEIEIGQPYKVTTPDLYYEDIEDDIKVAVYLDGLSKGIHGNDERNRVDKFIRMQLEDMFVDVVELSVSDLDDPVLLRKALSRIANKLRDRGLRSKYR